MGSKRRRSRSDDEALRYLKRIFEQPLPPPAFPDGTTTTMSSGEMFEFLKGRIVRGPRPTPPPGPSTNATCSPTPSAWRASYREALESGMVDPVLVADAADGEAWTSTGSRCPPHPRAHVARTIGPDATRAVLPEAPPRPSPSWRSSTRADGGEEFHSYTMHDPGRRLSPTPPRTARATL